MNPSQVTQNPFLHRIEPFLKKKVGWKRLALVRLAPLTGRKHQLPYSYTLTSNPPNLKPVTPTPKPQTSHPTSRPPLPHDTNP